MEKSDLTWGDVLPIWWACSWRAALFATLEEVAAGVVLGFMGLTIRLASSIRPMVFVLGLLLGFDISVWSLKVALTEQYDSLRVTVTKIG